MFVGIAAGVSAVAVTGCVNREGNLVPPDPIGRALFNAIDRDDTYYGYDYYEPREVVVTRSMPRPVYEQRPTLSGNYADPIYVDGHYYWNGNDYVWQRGRWVNRPRPNVRWNPPGSVNRGGRTYYRSGYWG